MIILTQDEYLKLQYLSTLFEACTVDELKARADGNEIVSRLKGNAKTNSFIINQLIDNHNSHEARIADLENNLYVLKSEIITLIGVMNEMYQLSTPAGLAGLKQKYNIY